MKKIYLCPMGRISSFFKVFILAILMLGFGVKSWSQTLYDSFSDGDFTVSPIWGGNTPLWTIAANSDASTGATGSNTVRLNSSASSTDYLSSQIATWGTAQEWNFFAGRRLQAFTGPNQQYFWLYANESTLNNTTVDGYRLAIGDDTGGDEIRLEYIVNGAVSATVITSSGSFPNGLIDFGFLVRVTRTSTGDWSLYTSTLPTVNGTGAIATDVPSTANTSVFQGSATHNTLVPASNGYIGLAALHTSGVNNIVTAEFDMIYFTPTTPATPNITLSSLNPAVAAATLIQQTNNNPIYRFDLSVSVADAALNEVTFTTAIGYAAANITNFKCWYSADATFNSGSDVLLSTKTTVLGPGTHIFPSFTSQVITNGTTGYIFITTDLPCAATSGNTLQVSAITNANLSFASGTSTGTAFSGGVQTFTNLSPANATLFATSNCTNAGTTLIWTNPSCFDQVMVVAKTTPFTAAIPTGDGTGFTDNPIYGSGTLFDGGFVVYEGTASTVAVTGLTNGQIYYYKIFSRKGTNWSAGSTVSCTPILTYCIPTITTCDEYFSRVVFGTIDNSSGANCGTTSVGYSNFTALSTNVIKGDIVSITTYVGELATPDPLEGYLDDDIRIWADWNQDGDFVDAGETLISLNNNGGAGSFNTTVPLTANTGSVRLRLRLVYNDESSSCGNSIYGETEDYTLNVSVPCTPTTVVSSFLPATGPVGTIVTISGTGFSTTPATGGVKFGDVLSTNYQVVSDTRITAEVPAGVAASSIIKVANGSACFGVSLTGFSLLTTTGTCVGVMSDLIISEVFDPASGNDHYVEIYNGTANNINLNTPNNYAIQIVNYPSNTVSSFDISGDITPGEIKVYYAGTNGGLATTPVQGGSAGFNEDDEIRLLKNGAILDRMVAPVAIGYNWRRANTVTGPNATYTSSEWSLKETVDGNLSTADIRTFTVAGSSIDFITQPADQACNFSMDVTASGSPTAYQWKYYNTTTNTWDNVTSLAFAPATIPTSGVGSPTSSTLTISGDISGFLNYQFYMEIGKSGCGKISNAAQFLYSTKKYYFSNISTGNWTTPGSWTMSEDITGAGAIATCTYPIAINSSGVYIRNGHTITLDTDVRENGVKIETGGSLITNANSTLDVLNGVTGADLIIKGSFTDGANSANTVGFVSGATWEISTGATIVKTNSSGAAVYRDNYETGIINIPSGANWIYRYDNAATSTIGFASSAASSVMYYPNLTLENTVSGNTFSSGFNAGSPTLSSFTMLGANNPIIIYGNFNVGGAGPGFINFINLNSYAPVWVDGNLEVKAGNMLTNFGNASNAGAGFEIKGNIIQNGTLTVNGNNSGTLLLSGTAAQTISGDNAIADNMNVQNLTLTNTVGVSTNKDFNIYGIYTMANNAKFGLGTGSVSLKSTTINTASIAEIPSTATIAYTGTGRFSIERYLPAYKSWRLLATPVNPTDATGTPSTISTAWREGGAVVSGLGTQITGPATGTGLDATTQRGSMKWFDESLQNYKEITNTGDPIARKEGYYLFVRGDRNVGVSGTASATTLRIKGRIFDPVNPPPPTNITLAEKFASIGNPYASSIDFSTLFVSALRIDNSYIAWDPTIAGAYNVGGFQTVTASTGYLATPGGSVFYNSTSDYRNIQSGQAFFVKSTASGASVSFAENMKAAGVSRLAARNGNFTDPSASIAMFSTMLFAANGQIADGNRVVLNDVYSPNIDNNDASKMWNSSENFAMWKNNETIVVEARPNWKDTDTIFYSMTNLKTTNYQLRFAVQNIPQTGLQAFLIDRFMQTNTPISLTDSSYVNFNVTSETESKASGRFMVVFRQATVLPLTFTKLHAKRNANGTVEVDWKTGNEIAVNKYEIEHSLNGAAFIFRGTKNPTNNTGGHADYNFTDVQAVQSENYYRIKTISNTGEIHYSAVVKVAALSKAISISVNPNPVINKTVHLQMNNAEVGLYTLQLINNSGQVVYRGSITVSSNFQTIDFALKRNISSGNYRLMIKPQTGKEIIQRITIL